MLLWAALKVTVHATIQLKLVFSFFLCFFGMCVLVWFGFVSGFPKMNPLPCEKEESCMKHSLCISESAQHLMNPLLPPCCCILMAQLIIPNALSAVRSHGFHQDVFSLYVSHPFIDLFFLLLHKQDSTYLQEELLEVTLESLEKHRVL